MKKLGTQFGYIETALGATETTETDLGDITVPVGASRITGICAACAIATGTAGDGCVGRSRISFAGSGEIDGVPTAIAVMEELGGAYVAKFTPVNIPCTALQKIHCYMTLSIAQAGACTGLICLRFE